VSHQVESCVFVFGRVRFFLSLAVPGRGGREEQARLLFVGRVFVCITDYDGIHATLLAQKMITNSKKTAD
jgi:hypothetical protein